jgi:hypothetical protein
MIRKSIKLAIILLAFAFSQCGNKEIVELQPKPNWVQIKPSIPGYYIGIGSAQKTGTMHEYQQTAKNNALADLSSEISVNISTSSILHQFESSLGYSEGFDAEIKASSKARLEGYEMINVFEDQEYYWVYYRLSKEKHKALEAQKKQAVINKTLDFYQRADNAQKEESYLLAIQQYIKGIESMGDYMGESLETEVEGTSIELGNALVSGFLNTLNDILIEPAQPTINVKLGDFISPAMLSFTVTNTKSKALAGIPVKYTMGRRPLRNNNAKTNLEGKVSYSFDRFQSKKHSEAFVATIDIENIINSITTNPFLRKMGRKIKAPSAQISVFISTPNFFVQSEEKVLGNLSNKQLILNKVSQQLTAKGHKVVLSKAEADFIVDIHLDTQEQKKEGKMFYAKLFGEIKVMNHEGVVVHVQPISNITGVQLDYRKASADAYLNCGKKIERNFLNYFKNLGR